MKKFLNEGELAFMKKIRVSVSLTNLMCVLAVAIITFLPKMNFVHSVENSGEAGLYIMLLSPVLSFIALFIFSFVFFKNFPKDDKSFKKTAVIFGIYILFLCFICFGTLLISVNQWNLGFVAELDGTYYNTIKNIMIVVDAISVIFGITL